MEQKQDTYNKNKPIEFPRKLTWMQSLALKKAIKKMRKEKKEREEKVELKTKEKNEELFKMIECIKEMLEIFEIEHNGKELTKEDVILLSYEEALEIFDDGLKALEKIV